MLGFGILRTFFVRYWNIKINQYSRYSLRQLLANGKSLQVRSTYKSQYSIENGKTKNYSLVMQYRIPVTRLRWNNFGLYTISNNI